MTTPSRRRADEWQRLINEQVESGSTQKAFCEERNIRLATFGHWKRKLLATAVSTEADTSWLELSHGLRSQADGQSPWKIELDLGHGVVLRLSQQS